MPAKNIVKIYVEGGYYHLYNRGVEKRRIFEDSNDYFKFLNLIKIYLSPAKSVKRSDLETGYYNRKNLNGKIELLAYCLMPNHFHLLVHQFTKDAITKFMQNLNTSYVIYFNKKYERVGTLFQGNYKAVNIENDFYLLHLSRYIHLNPMSIRKDFSKYPYSSYDDYLKSGSKPWLNSQLILNYFREEKKESVNGYLTYQQFVEDYKQESDKLLENLTLEN